MGPVGAVGGSNGGWDRSKWQLIRVRRLKYFSAAGIKSDSFRRTRGGEKGVGIPRGLTPRLPSRDRPIIVQVLPGDGSVTSGGRAGAYERIVLWI